MKNKQGWRRDGGRDKRRNNRQDRYHAYETEKWQLQRMGLTEAEYENAIKALCRRLKV